MIQTCTYLYSISILHNGGKQGIDRQIFDCEAVWASRARQLISCEISWTILSGFNIVTWIADSVKPRMSACSVVDGTDRSSRYRVCWWMDPMEKKGVHLEVKVGKPFPDTPRGVMKSKAFEGCQFCFIVWAKVLPNSA